MTLAEEVDVDRGLLAAMVLQYRIEKFYNDEAALLDAHDYENWVQLFTDDTQYFMPVRRTRLRRELGKEFTKPGEIGFFDDDKQALIGRWKKVADGTSWAEDPPSRTRHLITNIRIVADDGAELSIQSNFHVYRTRLKSEEDSWIGSRHDRLRRAGSSFQIATRIILLEQTVLQSRNLTTMF